MTPQTFIRNLRWEYEQRTGDFYLADSQNGRALIARGYSGKGIGLNAPEFEDRISEGPIPRGEWRVYAPAYHVRLGPLSFALAFKREGRIGPAPHSRSGFYIHGDNAAGNGTASSGCIILDKSARGWIAELVSLGVDQLTVV